MPEPSAKSDPEHPRRLDRWLVSIPTHLRKWRGNHGHRVHHHFLQGVAYKLGSGAVTVLILWWEARR
jgi:hypothetical protein